MEGEGRRGERRTEEGRGEKGEEGRGEGMLSANANSWIRPAKYIRGKVLVKFTQNILSILPHFFQGSKSAKFGLNFRSQST